MSKKLKEDLKAELETYGDVKKVLIHVSFFVYSLLKLRKSFDFNLTKKKGAQPRRSGHS